MLKDSLEPEKKTKFTNRRLQFWKRYIDKLVDTVNKYTNIYQKTIKIKPVDVKSNTYIDSSRETDDKGNEFKIGDIVTTSKYQNISEKGYTLQIGLKKFL